MKKLFLAFGLLIASIASASAACVSPGVMHDFPGTAFNMSLATVPDGNCGSNVAIPTWAGGTLGAMANYGTSPGAVLVPGTNAFITNVPAVSQSGTWNVTNVSGTVSLPTGASTSANQTSQITQETASAAALGTTADAACGTDNGTCSAIALIKRGNQNSTTLNTTASSAQAAGGNRIGYTTDDPCNNASTKVYTPVNVVTATNVIIAGVSAKKKYLCGIFLYPGGADNIAVYQATTGTSCATAATDIFGGHTTATGFLATATAGFVVGTGSAAFAATTTVNTDICITTSAAVQLSGAVVTVDQ